MAYYKVGNLGSCWYNGLLSEMRWLTSMKMNCLHRFFEECIPRSLLDDAKKENNSMKRFELLWKLPAFNGMLLFIATLGGRSLGLVQFGRSA